MRYIIFKTIILIFIVALNSIAFCQEGMNATVSLGSKGFFESRNGFKLPASGVIRVLIVFAEYEYANGGDPTAATGTAGWPAHNLPTWANELTDVNPPLGDAKGMMTRYYQMASSGNYTVLGDYLMAPDNGGIFKVHTDSAHAINPDNTKLIAAVNSKLGNTIVTAHGLNSVSYFDLWTCTDTDFGLPKTTPSTENPGKYDDVIFIWRNSTFNGIGDYAYTSPGKMLGHDANTYCVFGTYENIPTQIMVHEYAHLIYGGLDFHCGGGGWFMGGDYWLPSIGGWSNLGLSGSSLLSWNAWDRLRLGWKSPGNAYSISARNAGNTQELNGDLDASQPEDAGIYTLRDFTTTGDAIRIKLPFLDPEKEFPEFLWIENHNTFDMNQCPWDKFLWQDGNTCVEPATYGLYSYMQIDREARQGNTFDEVFKGYAYYLRPITAEGFYDKDFENTKVPNNCVNPTPIFPFTRLPENSNPLTGSGDQEFYSVDWNHDDIIDHNDQYYTNIENIGGVYYKNLFNNGHTRNAFTINGNKKIGISTNPTSAAMMNMVGYDTPVSGAKNIRKVYLNGVSVEILNQNIDGTIQVQVRFDDVDVNKDVRWCADKIVLNPIPTASGYSLILKANKTITLDQGTTATRMTEPIEYNGKKVFASPTVFTVEPEAKIHLEENASLVLKNLSTLRIKSAASVIIEDSGYIEVKSGTTFCVDDCGFLAINGFGKLVLKSGAVLCVSANAVLAFENGLQNLEMEPGVIIPAGFVDPSSLVCPTINSISVTSDTIWENRNLLVTGLVSVEQNKVLVIKSSTLKFKDRESKIIVKPGGKLVVDGSILSSACNLQWQGIEVWGNSSEHQYNINGSCGQGEVELKNGAIIENAYNAITNWCPNDFTSSGGIIKAGSGTIFRNNRRSIEFVKYKNFNPVSGNETDNISSFTNCTFQVDSLYPGNAAPFYAQVSLWDVNGVRFSGCDFLNKRSGNPAGYGIHSIDAGFRVSGIYGYSVTQNQVTVQDSSSFKGFEYGMLVSNTETGNGISVKNSKFVNNGYGIEMDLVNNAKIIGNEFKMGQSPNCAGYGYGIVLLSCSGYAIEENTFAGGNSHSGALCSGIEFANSGSAYNEVYKNKFQNLNVAILADGQNASPTLPETGLTFLCNTNSGNNYDFYVTNNPASTIAPMQKSGVFDAGNTFSENAVYNFYNGGGSEVSYFHSQNNGPVNNAGIKLVPTGQTNACPSHFTGNYGNIISSDETEMQKAELSFREPKLKETKEFGVLKPSLPDNIHSPYCTHFEPVYTQTGMQNRIKGNQESDSWFKISPNPATQWVVFDYKLSNSVFPVWLTIYDMHGHRLEQIGLEQNQGQIVLDVHSYPSGMYFYKSAGNQEFRGKFIVR
ncbi:MAG: T9SS type A sorting domain-containing protein [Bacteroidales bacterium]